MKIHVYDDIERLQQRRGTWNLLWSVTPQATFFQTLDWLTAYWKHFGREQKLHVLEFSQRSETFGFLPLVVRREATRLGPVRYLTYPLDYWGSFYGPLGREPQRVLREGLSYLKQTRRDWDVLELRWVGVDDSEFAAARQLLADFGMAPVAGVIDRTAIIELTGDWQSYLAERGSKWRNNLRRWQRRLERVGELRFERYRSPQPGSDPRWDLFEECLQVARASWQGSSESGTTISHSEISDFIRDAHQAAADCGCVDMNLIYFDDRPAAFAYNYHSQSHVFGLRIGYDPQLRSHGVGNVLYANIIEDSFRRGDRRYDLGPGSLEAKRYLYTSVLPIHRLSCFQPLSLRQQLLRWKRQRDAAKLTHELA